MNTVEIKEPLGQPMRRPSGIAHTIINVAINPGNKASATKTILKNFASKAWRRPATDEEVRKLQTLVQLAEKEGDTYERGVQLAVQATLVSPDFFSRWNLTPRREIERSRLCDFGLRTDLPDVVFPVEQSAGRRTAETGEVEHTAEVREPRSAR